MRNPIDRVPSNVSILTLCTVFVLSGCVHFESNPIPPSVVLSPENLRLDDVERDDDGVDFGVEVRPNESDSLANIEILPGLKVSTVHPNGPADIAGIDINDVILSVDGIETNDLDTLNAIAEQSSPNQQLSFVVRRGTTALEATVIARQAKRSIALRELYRIDPVASRAAYRTEILDPPNDSQGSAVRVVGIEEDSPLHDAGIQEGDIVTRVGSREVHSAQSLVNELVENYSPGSAVILTVLSDGSQSDRTVLLWDPGEYLSRMQLWPLFRYEFRPSPMRTIFQFPDILPIYRKHTTEFETHHQLLLFFSIRHRRNPPDRSTDP